MATHVIPILGSGTLADTSSSVYQEPAAVNFQSNDRYPHLVWVFQDTATRIVLGGTFRVPANYVGTAKILVVWGTTVTTGKVTWEFNYTAIATGETADPSADQEAVTSTGTTVPGTARLYAEESITLTSANLAAGDTVQFGLARDGSDATNDTAAAAAYVANVYFSYADV